MLADLHSHTHLSDGTLTPEALVLRAAANRVDFLAITDHDCTEGALLLTDDMIPVGLTVIPGVEISTLWEGKEIHVVGLGIDPMSPSLSALLQRQQHQRRERAQAIDLRLQKAGHTGLMAYLDTLACRAISRNHVADFLISRGIAKSKDHAFKKMLGDDGRYTASAHWCEPGEAISVIHAAGGLAVLAHPLRYGTGKMQFKRLLAMFSQQGGDAMEVSYSNVDPQLMQQLAAACLTHGLWASTGSDFHTPDNQWMDVGRFRHLPATIAEKALWLHPEWTTCSQAWRRIRDA